ncbi:MAG: peptidylprolyl isomerase [Candidatus Omnitrophica bacterium]|nr:peptidylprolyl isomerase [Candidatus Omnitrophota bacterium]
MLKILRQKGVKKQVLWFISGIIIISFGFGFGMSRYSGQISLTDSAGKVFGKKVSISEFREKYLDTRDQAMMMYGEKFRNVSAMMDLDGETWTRLILVKEANRRNIKVSDAEVIAYIQTIPLFQREGEFDQESYERMVKNAFQREPRTFEEGLRDQIKIMKMFRAETMGLNVPDETVRKEYERRNQKVQVDYVLIDPKTFTSAFPLSDKEMQDYFAAHGQEFMEPDSVKLQYAVFSFAPKATEDEKKAVIEKATAFYKKTTNKTDFAAAAKAAGADVKETGFFNMEQPETETNWTLETQQKIFEASAGDMLAPVQSAAGIDVLKIADKKAAFIPAFEKASDKVKERMLAEKTLAKAREKAADVQKAIAAKVAGGTSFDASAREQGLEKKTTPFFALGEYVPEIGISDDFASAAFALNKDKRLSDVVNTSRGPVVLYWQALQPIDEKKFEEVKKEFSNTLYEEQKVAAMNRVIKEIKEKAGLESYLDKIKR